MRMLEFELGSCWQPHTAHDVATTRAAGRAGRHATMIVEDLQTLGSQPVMPENLPNHWQACHAWRHAMQGGREAWQIFWWALGWIGPDYVDYQRVSPGGSEMGFSTPRHSAATLIAACVVSGGHPRPIRDTGLSCLPVVWHGPETKMLCYTTKYTTFG